MEDSELLFYLLIVLPYLFAIVMPGWRWLMLPLAIGVLGGLWAFVLRPIQTEGLELAIEQIFFTIAAVGLVAGTSLRAVTLFLGTRATPAWISVLITLAGAIALIASLKLFP